MQTLDTGDILLCHHNDAIISFTSNAIEYYTNSTWNHTAMIIKNPSWINDALSDGLYVLQSNPGPNSYDDVINGSKSGVTLNHLDDFLKHTKNVYVRTLCNFNSDNKSIASLKSAFNLSHGKSYDKKSLHLKSTSICNCICFPIKLPRLYDNFGSSSLIFYIYAKMAWTNEDAMWTTKMPVDLISIQLNQPYSLSELWNIN